MRKRRSAVALGGLLALLLLVGCEAEDKVPEGAFYLEAEILVSGDASAGPSEQVASQPQGTGLRWWSHDPGHYRHEFYDPSAMLEWGPRWTVADGENVTFYDPRLGSYQRRSLAESGLAGLNPTFSALVGPLPAPSIDEFIAEWGGRVETIERTGAEEFLGRRVEVIEYGPTWSSSGASAEVGGTPGVVAEESGGIGRFYIDAEAGFILRHEVDGGAGGQSYSAEVTLLDLEPEFEDDTFSPELPSDAVEVKDSDDGCSSRGSGSGGGLGLEFTQMPLRFAVVPEGWASVGSGSSHSSACELQQEWSALGRGEGDLIVVSQRPVPTTGVPAPRRDATAVDIDGNEGYHLSVGDLERLLWVQDDVIVLIESNAAPLEELVRIAETAE